MYINGHTFTVGADPEVFIERKKDKAPVSAFGLCPGTKKNPFVVRSGGAVQVDGMALEFNTVPVGSPLKFLGELDRMGREVRKFVPTDCEVSRKYVMDFGSEFLKKQPLAARELGCDPDYNAYTESLNPVPNVDTPFRTASGHIHIGWTKNKDPLERTHFQACVELTKNLDRFLGYNLSTIDEDPRRRELYGKAGAFRPKPYGMEYRVPSNTWIFYPKLAQVVFSWIHQAIMYSFVETSETTFNRFRNFIDNPDPGRDNYVRNMVKGYMR